MTCPVDGRFRRHFLRPRPHSLWRARVPRGAATPLARALDACRASRSTLSGCSQRSAVASGDRGERHRGDCLRQRRPSCSAARLGPHVHSCDSGCRSSRVQPLRAEVPRRPAGRRALRAELATAAGPRRALAARVLPGLEPLLRHAQTCASTGRRSTASGSGASCGSATTAARRRSTTTRRSGWRSSSASTGSRRSAGRGCPTPRRSRSARAVSRREHDAERRRASSRRSLGMVARASTCDRRRSSATCARRSSAATRRAGLRVTIDSRVRGRDRDLDLAAETREPLHRPPRPLGRRGQGQRAGAVLADRPDRPPQPAARPHVEVLPERRGVRRRHRAPSSTCPTTSPPRTARPR